MSRTAPTPAGNDADPVEGGELITEFALEAPRIANAVAFVGWLAVVWRALSWAERTPSAAEVVGVAACAVVLVVLTLRVARIGTGTVIVDPEARRLTWHSAPVLGRVAARSYSFDEVTRRPSRSRRHGKTVRLRLRRADLNVRLPSNASESVFAGIKDRTTT